MEKLTPTQIKILKYFTNVAGISRVEITNSVLAHHFGENISYIKELTGYLFKMNFIERSSGDGTMKISPKGSEYLKQLKYDFYSHIFWNVLIPIIVSSITTILINK